MLLAILFLIATAFSATPPPPPIQPNSLPGYPSYTPTNIVRLMVVAKDDRAPFLTGVVTTQGDRLVVANIPNGDPPTAFNVTQRRGFRAQNGKYIFFDFENQKIHLDTKPHNDTQYLSNGSVYVPERVPGEQNRPLYICPGPGNIFSIEFGCTFGAEIDIFPIPPQHLTSLWENHTEYPSPKQRGWLNPGVNVTVDFLGDNSTFDPISLEGWMGGYKRAGGVKTEVGMWGVLGAAVGVLLL